MSPKPRGWGNGTGGLCNDTWRGVTCTGGCVVKVDLHYKKTILPGGYSGHVDFTSLPQSVQQLDLHSNFFSGTPVLTALPQSLRSLNLYNSGFGGEVDLGSLPQSLEYLTLSYNTFSGVPNLSALPQSLKALDFRVNHFHGTPDFTKLPKSLETFVPDANRFQGSGRLTPLAKWCTEGPGYSQAMCVPSTPTGPPNQAFFDCKAGTWYCY
eukprot:Hpha_TRINITY_DN29062_c0_g1::TRINITY_DN29062_c0_g1_i1::g.156473::m.156473